MLGLLLAMFFRKLSLRYRPNQRAALSPLADGLSLRNCSPMGSISNLNLARRIPLQELVKVLSTLVVAVGWLLYDHARRCNNDEHIGRNVGCHNRIGANDSVVPNGDVSQYGSSTADVHTVPEFRRLPPAFMAAGPDRHVLANHTIVADFGVRMDNDARLMV
jgi:hypothetical protein